MRDRLAFTKRQALSLAAALTLVVGTGATAIAGLAHTPAVPAGRPAVAVPVAPVTPSAQEVDD